MALSKPFLARTYRNWECRDPDLFDNFSDCGRVGWLHGRLFDGPLHSLANQVLPDSKQFWAAWTFCPQYLKIRTLTDYFEEKTWSGWLGIVDGLLDIVEMAIKPRAHLCYELSLTNLALSLGAPFFNRAVRKTFDTIDELIERLMGAPIKFGDNVFLHSFLVTLSLWSCVRKARVLGSYIWAIAKSPLRLKPWAWERKCETFDLQSRAKAARQIQDHRAEVLALLGNTFLTSTKSQYSSSDVDNEKQLQDDSSITTEIVSRAEVLGGKRFVVLYFCAGWCGLSKQFTNQLTHVYHQLKQDCGGARREDRSEDSDFEIVLVSLDQNEAEFNEHFAEMPWHALPWSSTNGSSDSGSDGGNVAFASKTGLTATNVGDISKRINKSGDKTKFSAQVVEAEQRERLARLLNVHGIPTLVVLELPSGRVLNGNAYAAVANRGAKGFPWPGE